MEIYPEMVNAIYNDFKTTVKELVSKGSTNATKHVSRDCSWCEYQPLCYGQFTGADLDYIIEKDYTVKENKNDLPDTSY
jgi:sulfatase maturation enzyme AslB (radical SAM superfamily)